MSLVRQHTYFIKSKYQKQGCKSFVINLKLPLTTKCCLLINEQQAKVITIHNILLPSLCFEF